MSVKFIVVIPLVSKEIVAVEVYSLIAGVLFHSNLPVERFSNNSRNDSGIGCRECFHELFACVLSEQPPVALGASIKIGQCYLPFSRIGVPACPKLTLSD